MATPEITNIVIDAIVAAFDADPVLFEAFQSLTDAYQAKLAEIDAL